MGTELPKTHDSSGTDSNSDSENSSTSDSSGSNWECSSNKQSSVRKPHFSVTSCDTGLKLKIAAIPRKATPKKGGTKPAGKKKLVEAAVKTIKSNKDRPAVRKKGKSQLSDTTSSSESCKCSSNSSSDDDLPLKAVSKTLHPKASPQKPLGKNTKSNIKSDSEDDKQGDKDTISKVNKDKQCAKTVSIVKKTKSDEIDTSVKKGRGRPRTKVSTISINLICI